MLHEDALRECFEFKCNKGWTALVLNGRAWLKPYRTTRVAKVQDDCFYFTIGETQLGKAAGLSSKFERLIEARGLCVKEIPTTGPGDKLYVGFALQQVGSSDVLRLLLEQALHEVKGSALPCASTPSA